MIPPEILDPAVSKDAVRISQLIDDESIEVVDRLDHQVEELKRINSISGEKVEGNYAGCWIYLPWNEILIRTLNQQDFKKVRTNRNQNKITAREQETLGKKRVGIIGMSVGRSIATTMAMERIFGHLKIADFGLSKIIPKRSRTHSFCGSPEYMCPEILLGQGHDRRSDVL